MEIFALPQDQQEARARAARLFDHVRNELVRALPSNCKVLHVGATAIIDCLTKGDLDIVIRCDAADFALADEVLASRFQRNLGSIRTFDFSAFESKRTAPELGVQLTARGGGLDVFHLFAAALQNDPALVRRYNDLKRRHDGQFMDVYRAAKDAFISSVLDA